MGNSAAVVDAQPVFKSTFKALINEDYSISIDTERYQDVLEHALSKVDFTGILQHKHIHASKKFELKH